MPTDPTPTPVSALAEAAKEAAALLKTFLKPGHTVIRDIAPMSVRLLAAVAAVEAQPVAMKDTHATPPASTSGVSAEDRAWVGELLLDEDRIRLLNGTNAEPRRLARIARAFVEGK